MSHSYAQNHIHLVFSTKDRQRLIVKAMQKKLWAYMAGVCKSYDMLAFAIGGWRTMYTSYSAAACDHAFPSYLSSEGQLLAMDA